MHRRPGVSPALFLWPIVVCDLEVGLLFLQVFPLEAAQRREQPSGHSPGNWRSEGSHVCPHGWRARQQVGQLTIDKGGGSPFAEDMCPLRPLLTTALEVDASYPYFRGGE